MSNDASRRFAVQVVRTLREAGYQALWAGGCVRDQLLGHTPKDYDVATSALPDRVREVFGKRRTLPIGAAFGVITVLGPKDAGQIEVATFRTDADYSDGRRPDAVQFSDAKHDASRRDFTINGLFYDPIDEKVIDYVGGQQDLQRGVVRAIGAAAERFAEDKLRMLRAVRFAAGLEFAIDDATSQAIAARAEELQVVSAERIGAELRRMLTGADAPRAVRLMQQHGLLAVVVPELAGADEPTLQHFADRWPRLATRTLPTTLACLMLGATSDGAQVTMRAMALKFTRKEAERAGWLVDRYNELAGADVKPWSTIQPLLASAGGGELVAVYEAVAGGPNPASRYCRQKLALPPDELDPPPLVTGVVLKQHGLAPGPKFGAWLQAARDAQLNGQIATTVEAVDLITKLQASDD